MLFPSGFYSTLQSTGFDYFAGVPDSLLKNFCGYVSDHASPGSEILAVNEETELALVEGHVIDPASVATACRYCSAMRINPGDKLPDEAVRLCVEEAPSLLVNHTNIGVRSNLGRPTIAPLENRMRFLRNLVI
jgi:hypothetical protein